MSTYLIGDVHGCYDELIALLKQVDFTPGQDTLWLTGDLVARGPGSLDVLRYVKSLGDSVRMVLGNHDLHLLAVYAGISRNKPKDRITPLLEAPDADELLNWLRRQPLLQIDEEKKLVMAHAGITPQWDLETAKPARATPKRCWRATPTRSSLMRCTATCQITGVMTSAAWHDCVLSPMLLRGCATASRTGNWICIAKIRLKMPLRRLSHGLRFRAP